MEHLGTPWNTSEWNDLEHEALQSCGELQMWILHSIWASLPALWGPRDWTSDQEELQYLTSILARELWDVTSECMQCVNMSYTICLTLFAIKLCECMVFPFERFPTTVTHTHRNLSPKAQSNRRMKATAPATKASSLQISDRDAFVENCHENLLICNDCNAFKCIRFHRIQMYSVYWLHRMGSGWLWPRLVHVKSFRVV